MTTSSGIEGRTASGIFLAKVKAVLPVCFWMNFSNSVSVRIGVPS